jgi:hypothetical protein
MFLETLVEEILKAIAQEEIQELELLQLKTKKRRLLNNVNAKKNKVQKTS